MLVTLVCQCMIHSAGRLKKHHVIWLSDTYYLWSLVVNVAKLLTITVITADAPSWTTWKPVYEKGMSIFGKEFWNLSIMMPIYDFSVLSVTANYDVTLLIALRQNIGAHLENSQRSCEFSIQWTDCLDSVFMLNPFINIPESIHNSSPVQDHLISVGDSTREDSAPAT